MTNPMPSPATGVDAPAVVLDRLLDAGVEAAGHIMRAAGGDPSGPPSVVLRLAMGTEPSVALLCAHVPLEDWLRTRTGHEAVRLKRNAAPSLRRMAALAASLPKTRRALTLSATIRNEISIDGVFHGGDITGRVTSQSRARLCRIFGRMIDVLTLISRAATAGPAMDLVVDLEDWIGPSAPAQAPETDSPFRVVANNAAEAALVAALQHLNEHLMFEQALDAMLDVMRDGEALDALLHGARVVTRAPLPEDDIDRARTRLAAAR